MNADALETRLTEEGISLDVLSIGRDKDDTYCVMTTPTGGFAVYFSERGHRWDERIHPNESEALEDLLARILEDESTRISFQATHRWPGEHQDH